MVEEVEAEDQDLEIADDQDPGPTSVVPGALPATVPWSVGGHQAMTTSGQALVVTADGHPVITHALGMETGMVLAVAGKNLGLAPDPKLDLTQDLAGFLSCISDDKPLCAWAKKSAKESNSTNVLNVMFILDLY